MFRKLLTLALIACCISCHYDVEEDLVVQNECDVRNVSYSMDINPIVENRCLQCHAASLNLGGITLEGYNQLKNQVDNGRLLGAVKREPGFSPMPQNESMLPSCQVSKIEAWIEAGAPNN